MTLSNLHRSFSVTNTCVQVQSLTLGKIIGYIDEITKKKTHLDGSNKDKLL